MDISYKNGFYDGSTASASRFHDKVELLKKIKVVEPIKDVEKLADKRQAYIAGQIRVIMLITEILDRK